MSKLFMDTDQVESMARRIHQAVAQMETARRDVESAQGMLSWAWSGDSSNEFRSELFRILQRIEDLGDQGSRLANRALNEATEWIEMDASFGRSFRGGEPDLTSSLLPDFSGSGGVNSSTWPVGVTGLPVPLMAAALPGLAHLWENSNVRDSSVNIGGEFAGDFAQTLVRVGANALQKQAIITFFTSQGGNLGRMMNYAFGQGYVGRCEEFFGNLGRVIKNDVLKAASEETGDFMAKAKPKTLGINLGVSSFVGDFISGVYDGENVGHAAGTALVTGAIIGAGSYFIPGVGQLMVANSLVQLGGSGAVLVLEKLGYQDSASILKNSLEAVDLQGYVSDGVDGLVDCAVDFLSNPSNTTFSESFHELGDRFKPWKTALGFS